MKNRLERLLSSVTHTRKRNLRPHPAVAALGGFGVGAAAAYLLDPQRGHRRRSLARDKALHALRVQQHMLEQGARDLVHRARGVGPRISHWRSDHPSDEVLIARVRSELGRHTSHAHAITVDADEGDVTLAGPVLADEVKEVLRAVRRVRGVRQVHDQLEVHADSGRVPGLQGEGSVPRSIVRREQWPPALRLVSVGSGLAAATYGLARGGSLGAVVGTAGTLAALRGISNISVRRMLGVAREPYAVITQRSIIVRRPIDEVFAFWSSFENLPRFMDHVLDVEPGPGEHQSRWHLRGPAGITWTWEIETTELVPNERIAWQAADDTSVEHEGSVRFERVSDGETRVHLRMSDQPTAGPLGHAIAALLGRDPKRAMERSLQSMQSLLERETPAEGVSSMPTAETPLH